MAHQRLFTQAEMDQVIKDRICEWLVRLLTSHMRVELQLKDEIVLLKAEIERLRAAQRNEPEAQIPGGHEQ